jgi:uncharacterized circularly permuted ATP-grasp superfamily protein/uncharacterized alpha-E superfamily protein
MSSLLFESYRGIDASRDEWKADRPGVTGVYDHIESVLSAYTPAELERLTRRAQEFMREQGITFNLYDDPKSTERILPFDLFPLTISAEEWAQLELGLAQRVKAWNSLLLDIYGSQEILKAGVIPYDLIYSDPRYHRECVGLKPAKDLYLHVAAVDLFRNAAGQWLVFEDQLSNPTGASYALQNRRALSQICPQLMEGQHITPIHNYATQLLETLQAVTPTGRSSARVVLLSPGIYNEAYYDHSSLARQMGIPLVQGGDLIVLDNHVYLKTIAGLERVEVIYRRLDSDFIDPVTFRRDSVLGVPGLVSCVRKGTVTIANALGSDIADNRALNAYMPGIIEFYLNESMLLPSVQTLSCRDIDVRGQIYEHWDRYVLKSVTSRAASSVWVGKDLTEATCRELRGRIDKNPGEFVAQPIVQFSTAPTWVGSSLEPRHVGIRAFILQNEKVSVTPCVLTRYANSAGSLVISSSAGGGSKDTWILRGTRREAAPPELVLRHEAGRMPLGSRTADSLYWIGRYTERTEATTRILRVIQQLRLEGDALQDPKSWHPLWEALATATGHPTSFFKKATIQKTVNLAQYILLEDENYASSVSCLRLCRQNAQQIREALPPEVWTVLNGLYLELAVAADQKNTPPILERLQSLSLQDELLTQLDELSGSVEKHMLHNDAWHFWQIGRHLERALFTALTMRQVFLKRSDERLAGAQMTEDTNLDALLRMLAGQYAYRSSYRTRPVASQVAMLLIQDGEFPRSIVFCLESIRQSLQYTFGDKKAKADTPLHYCHHLLSELMFADVSAYFPAAIIGEDGVERRVPNPAAARQRTKAFSDWLQGVIERLLGLGTLVSDHYLNHQAASPVRPSH